MSDLIKQIDFFVKSEQRFVVKYNKKDRCTELWVDGFVYCYADDTGKFISSMSEELYTKLYLTK